jgi:hypothetical protein
MDILHEPWAQGIRLALKAYTRASDAYALNLAMPPVALWAVGIAGAIVLLEWVLARHAPHG